MHLLTNKNILIAVTGSIAAYKTLELVRLYIKAGARVKIIMSKGAKKFISALTFETISQTTILDDENENWDKESSHNHIAIGKWADIFIIAPATANTINKLSNGIADNILLQSALAYSGTILLAPAANTNMINNPITQKNLQTLQELHFKTIKTQVKELACRDVGDGAMAEPLDIFYSSVKELLQDSYWYNRKVVLTGGGTIEKIDDVRFISNFSSGKMAADLATALYYKGANVFLITTKELAIPKEISVTFVQSTDEMYTQLEATIKNKSEVGQKKPYFFSVAAVSDYIPSVREKGKLKKDDIGENWNLQLQKNRDILQTINKSDLFSIGFKAELDNNTANKNAKNMLQNKQLDAVCLNIINDQNNFGSDTNEIDFITKNDIIKIEKDTKINVSLKLLDTIKVQLSE